MSTRRNTGWALGATLLLGACSGHQTRIVSVDSGTEFAITGNSEVLYFDMQGIVWQLPPEGGAAVALTDPLDDLRRPQLSPEGTQLVMQSFATGHWDIVVFDTDGNNRRHLTQNESDDREPTWSADGRAVLFTSDRSGNDDIWSVDLATGQLTQLTDHPSNDYAPGVLPGGFVFVSDRERTPALYLRQDQQTRELARAPAGRIYPPRSSPDGSRVGWVQAAERNGFPGVAINELVVLDYASGNVQTLSTTGSDVFAQPPAWRDNTTLLYTADGVVQRINVDDKVTTTVPFTAGLPLITDRHAKQIPLAFSQATQPLLGIVDPVMLPDGQIVFTALGDLWQLDADEQLTQLTDDAVVERDLSLSPDGKTLAYIADRDGSMQIWLRDIATGADTRVTDRSNGPRYPTFSPDGTQLAYQQVGPIGTQDFTVRVVDLATGKSRKLRGSPKIWPGRMAWSADGTHIIVAELHKLGRASDGRNRLVRLNVANDTSDIIILPQGLTPDTGPVSNPSGTALALVVDGSLWQLPVTPGGMAAGEPELLLDALVESPAWSTDGKQVLVLGPAGMTALDAGSGDLTIRNPAQSWQPAAGQGRQLVHAGRMWDGTADTYLYNVDIVSDDARIVAVRPHTDHAAGMPVIDAAEHTVLPGLIDHHVHFEPHKGEWVGRSLLAFGVTTVVEPGGLPYESREHFESWQSGRRAGPRLVFAGPQLDGARRTFHFASHVANEQRLERELERGDRLGYGLLKTYRRLPPELQQRTVELGRERGLPVTAHAALRNIGLGGNRTEHLRGSSRTESSPKQSDLLNSYDDIQSIYQLPDAAVVPTLINQGGFFDVVLRRANGFDDVRQYTQLYTPAYRKNLAGFSNMVGRKIALVRTGLGNAGKTIKTLDEAGALVVAGTDSPIFPYGLSLVIELQNYVDAGLSPAAALRTATSNAAYAMGAGDEVGQIKAGLLADMVIVDGDPLRNIDDLFNVQGVMLNGRYRTLDELLE